MALANAFVLCPCCCRASSSLRCLTSVCSTTPSEVMKTAWNTGARWLSLGGHLHTLLTPRWWRAPLRQCPCVRIAMMLLCRKGLVRLSMLVFTFAGVLAKLSTIHDVILVFGLLMQRLADDTVDQLVHAACWSIDVLATGCWPSADHLHAPLTGPRALKHGPLAGGYFGICTQHLGDWKYIKEVCHLGRH